MLKGTHERQTKRFNDERKKNRHQRKKNVDNDLKRLYKPTQRTAIKPQPNLKGENTMASSIETIVKVYDKVTGKKLYTRKSVEAASKEMKKRGLTNKNIVATYIIWDNNENKTLQGNQIAL